MTQTTVFDDEELAALLRSEPELLAIADAIVATQTRQARRVSVRRLAPAAVALAAAVAAIALLALSPIDGSPSLAERALAAVGDRPVLHVAIEQPATGWPLVDLRTGAQIPRTLRTEIWFDEQRELKRTLSTLDGHVLDEVLETREGGWTRGGRVYTCAWIAAHPVEATRAGVSCNASGENGTEPREVPERPPTLEEALAGFVDHYRSALASGAAEEAGRARIDGREIVWLRFPGGGGAERVGVDADTFEPVLLAWSPEQPPVRVLVAETVAPDPALFQRPLQETAQTGGGVVSETELATGQAAAELAGAVWLGEAWEGLSLVAVERQERAISDDARPARRVPVLKLSYARVGPDGRTERSSQIELYEARTCLIRIGWTCSPHDPSSPGVLGTMPPMVGLLRHGDLYVSIWRGEAAPELLEIARALTPAP